MSIKDDQLELQRQNLSGIPGVFVSGVVWLVSGVVCLFAAESYAIAALFIGGVGIYPLSTLICRRYHSIDPASSINLLNRLGLESTGILFMGLVLAYFGRSQSPGYFFNTMLMTIGVRYLLFQTLYGLRIYWILGLLLFYTGLALFIFQNTWVPLGGLAGGVIEIGVAIYMLRAIKPDTESVR